MDHALWDKLCDDVLGAAIDLTGLELFQADLLARRRDQAMIPALRLIRKSLRDGWPVAVALMGAYDHITVVAGFSRTSLRLFDSSGHRWVTIRSITFADEPAGTAHHIPPCSVVALLAY